jgi:AmiR/NasT family two-component response regulator
VVIVESNVRNGRRTAEAVERLVRDVDVLLYTDVGAARAGIEEHGPDVVLVAPEVAGTPGADAVRALREVTAASIVALVDEPSPERSTAAVDAGANVVAQQPLGDRDLRTVLRMHGDGIPG